MEKKRVILLIPSLQAGGMERVMSEFAAYFSLKADAEIHLVLYGITREIFYSVNEQVIIHRPGFKFNNSIRLVSTLKTLLFIRKTIVGINPSTILSFGEYWNSFVLLALWGLRFPVYISDRCQPDKVFGKFHVWLRKVLYPKAAGIIAQSEKARSIYQSQFHHKNIEVIGNPIRGIKSNTNIKKENIILTVGRLISTKHHDRLIKLFLELSMPEWKLIIVGYDHLKQNISEKLKQLISDHHAEDSVILAGKQSDVESYYLRSKIFAFTSSSEGFPNVIGEAMSARLPVIAFDCVAGPSEMITDNETGFLIPLFDFDQFKSKLDMLIRDPELRHKFGENGYRNIQKFSISKVGEKAYNFILSGN